MQKDGIRDMVRDQLKRVYNPVLTERVPDDIRRLVERLR